MKYRTIVADPPWPYPNGFAGFNRTHGKWSRRVEKPLPYAAMSLEQIRALPVDGLADSDSMLFLWTTNRYLPDAFDVISDWGFIYRQTLVWHKPGFGPLGGTVAPIRSEFLLVCRRGKPKLSGKAKSSVITIPLGASSLRRHSQKPEAFLDLVEQVSPGPYLELFARTQRLGWDTWGNEALEHVEVVV